MIRTYQKRNFGLLYMTMLGIYQKVVLFKILNATNFKHLLKGIVLQFDES